MHGHEAKYAGQIDFVYIDIDDPTTAPFKRELGYRYQPHIFLLDGSGKIIGQWVGMVGEAELDAAFQAAMP
ncbi:MAG: hypothetical protein MUP44_05315 [Anaerolineales bacterium]|nr:hypothetical protein [Anaerolineales bacterium]